MLSAANELYQLEKPESKMTKNNPISESVIKRKDDFFLLFLNSLIFQLRKSQYLILINQGRNLHAVLQ